MEDLQPYTLYRRNMVWGMTYAVSAEEALAKYSAHGDLTAVPRAESKESEWAAAILLSQQRLTQKL